MTVPATSALEGRLSEADHDRVVCVQVLGLVEVKPERNAFGFVQTHGLPPGVSPSRVEGGLREPGAERIERLSLERT